MTRFSVKIEGGPLFAAMTALNSANVPTLGAGAHWGDAPSLGWDLTTLRAVVEAETPTDALQRVKAQLPDLPEASYELSDPEPYGD